MSWTREQFFAILNTNIGMELLADKEIAAYVNTWSDENKAALLHANNVTENGETREEIEEKRLLLQLVAAFSRKDLNKIIYLAFKKKVSVGARLDYLLPLYDAKYGAGEDVFVSSTKVMLGGDRDHLVTLNMGAMTHLVGPNANHDYSEDELKEIENYVNNSFVIQDVLQSAPNKTTIQPTKEAVLYILQNASIYRDSNQNPTIVFLPGAISIDGQSIVDMMKLVIQYGANINDKGFFGVSGLVWAIVLADVDVVEKFLTMGASIFEQDEMKNTSVNKWVDSTHITMADNPGYCSRLDKITGLLEQQQQELEILSST